MKLKTASYTLLPFVLVAIALSECDKITSPNLPKQQNSSLPNRMPDFTNDNSSTYKNYKVLLEDCMGHLCDNCPTAVNEAEALIAPSNPLSPHIVMMEVNMGGFAVTTTKQGFPDSAFEKDYTTIAGNYWLPNIFYPPSGYPAGYINRLGFTNAGLTNYASSNWQSTIQAQVNQYPTPPVEIKIYDSCWVPERIIGVELQVIFKKTLPGNYALETLIVEDSIFDWQLDNLRAEGYDSAYDHRNVLRGAFGNFTGGLPLGIGIPNPDADSTFTSYQTYDFTKGENGYAGGINSHCLAWKMQHCYVVAFVYNAATNATPYQVVQAEMIKIE